MSQSTGKPTWIWLALGGLALALIAGTIIYLSPGANLLGLKLTSGGKDSEASMACVANAFPVVVMEHGKFAIDQLLRELQAEGDAADEAGLEGLESLQELDDLESVAGLNDESDGFPERWVLSKDIDERFLELAKLIQSENLSESEALELQLHINSEIKELVALFQSQASDYMRECTQLFHEMSTDCDDLSGDSLASQQCMEKYQNRVTDLMAKHMDYTPGEAGL